VSVVMGIPSTVVQEGLGHRNPSDALPLTCRQRSMSPVNLEPGLPTVLPIL